MIGVSHCHFSAPVLGRFASLGELDAFDRQCLRVRAARSAAESLDDGSRIAPGRSVLHHVAYVQSGCFLA
jgi:hypothetical protein